MTDSRQLFIKVRLWFNELMNLTVSQQEFKLHELHQKNTLDEAQLKLLSEMLVADNLRKLKKCQKEGNNSSLK